jgi:DNA-binding XRE family transcriptional regulator
MAMPNIGTLLKQEVVRLARREIRAQMQATRKTSAQSRGYIAALKRQVATLERQVALLQRRAPDRPRVGPAGATATKVRFVAKGLKSHRGHLGLSAADYGRLAGVSAQSVYNWEQGHASPRPEQLATIAALRGIGKREAQQRLEQLRTNGAPRLRKR